MPSSISWKRYDEEHNVSAVLTEAARACVVENPGNVTDYFARYFREVAGGTSVKHICESEVVGTNGGPALTFTLELCTGPEVSITTSECALFLDCGLESADEESDDLNDEAAPCGKFDQLLQAVRSSLLPELVRLGSVEPQSSWDNAIASVWKDFASLSPSVPWAMSMLASLAAAKQRRITLYQHFGDLIDAHTLGNPDDASSNGGNKVAAAAATGDVFSNAEKGPGAAGGCYAPPRLIVPFVIFDTTSRGTDAAAVAGQVHFEKVYVGLEPIVFPIEEASESEGEGKSTNDNDTERPPVDGRSLRRRIRKLHNAARLFLTANPSAFVGSRGCLCWSGPGNYADIVKAVADALEAAELRLGLDVCIGLSLGGNKVRVRSNGEGEGGKGTGGSTTTAAASSKAAAAAAAAAAADPSGLYDFFYGDAAITGEQLTEYLKEQLEDIGQGVVQFLEDTHSMDDTVARQRLQLALQDSIVLSGNSVFENDNNAMNNATVGLAYAQKRTAEALAGTYPTTVVDLSWCGSVQAAAQLLRTVYDAKSSAVTALIGPTAGSAEAAAHLVDLAVAGRVSYLMTSTGPLSTITMAVASRFATVMSELAESKAMAPRIPFRRFNRYDLPPLPKLTVAPIRHKGDKKKKDHRNGAKKKK